MGAKGGSGTGDGDPDVKIKVLETNSSSVAQTVECMCHGCEDISTHTHTQRVQLVIIMCGTEKRE